MRYAIIAFFLLIQGSFGLAQSPGNVLSWIKFHDAENSLIRYLSEEAINRIDEHRPYYSTLQSPGDIQEYQEKIKETIWHSLGEKPEKTPLNARITNTIQKDGYTLENIIFESLPGFYVTGTLFIPEDITLPGPAILFCSGHSTEAFRRKSYQLPLLNLVKKGFIVLAIDPIGQGERSQYFDALKEKSDFDGRSTQEHSYPSVQSFLLGESVAKYFAWDGIRAIDYLCSRAEVDASRIGVHGLSGGGTQAAYISALDERVKASAPAGYITSYQRLIESIGVQDGEQNFYHGLKNGIDHLDFLLARAPKPTLVMATTNDFFSIQGAYETFEKASEVYEILGLRDHLEFTEDEYGHGYTRINREAMYRFFQKHLDLPGDFEESEVEFLSFHDLQKTSTGQISNSLGGETVFSLIRKDAQPSLTHLESMRSEPSKNYEQTIRSAVIRLSDYHKPAVGDEPVYVGKRTQPTYTLKMYFLKGEGDYVFPFLEYLPNEPNGKSVIYLNPGGKNAVPQTEIEYFIDKGFKIYIPDVIGTGELSGGSIKGDAFIDQVSYNLWFTAVLVGKSIVGIQASDLNKLAAYVKSTNDDGEVYGIAKGQMSPTLLHSGTMGDSFSRLLLIQPYASYATFVENKYYKPQFVNSLVPGALTGYDLADLAAIFAPKNLIIAGAMTQTGYQYSMQSFAKDWEIAQKIYKSKGSSDKIEFIDARYFREDNYHNVFDRLVR